MKDLNDPFSLAAAVLQITALNIVLSGDNVGVIALAIRNLPKKQAKIASLIGVGGAIILRIIFTAIVARIMMIEWLPIRLIGGILLLKITWDLLSMKEEECTGVKTGSGFWKAVFSIIIADLSMSLDNVLAIAGAANGNIWLIVFGIITSIPIIFFGAQFVASLMNKYRITIFIGGAMLIYTAISMILEDHFVISRIHVDHLVNMVIPLIAAVIVIAYGIKITRKGITSSGVSSGAK